MKLRFGYRPPIRHGKIQNLSRNSFTASFIDQGSKRDWIETLDTAFAAA